MMQEQQTTTTKVSDSGLISSQPVQNQYETKKVIFRAYQIIWYVLGLVEILLILRLIFKAFGANTFSSFTSMIYSLTDPLALPFAGIFGVTVTNQSVFEWSTVVAMAIYALIAYGIVKLIQLINPVTPDKVHETVDSQA